MSVPMVWRRLLLVDAEADAEADEQDDRGDAPDDAEHGEEAAKLGLPESGERLFEDFAKGHGVVGSDECLAQR